MIHLFRILAMCKACQIAEQNKPHGHRMWAMALYNDMMLRRNVYFHTGVFVEGYDLDMKHGA